MIVANILKLVFPKVCLYWNPLDAIGDVLSSVPIVGDLLGAGAEHASAKDLQNDSQAHDAHMFGMQAEHDKNMFGLESEWASAQAKKQYDRQRTLLLHSPWLQMRGLKKAGLNPILAATGGFKSPAGGSLPIPSARASSSAKGSGQSSPMGAKLALGEVKIRQEQAKLISQQRQTTAQQGWYYGAQAQKAQSEAKKADQETLREQYRNVKEGNVADVHSSSFGKFMAWAEVAGLDKVGAGAAIAIGGAAVAKLLGKLITKAPNPYIKGTKQYRAFEAARKREDKL
jgi:hypothetical protein